MKARILTSLLTLLALCVGLLTAELIVATINPFTIVKHDIFGRELIKPYDPVHDGIYDFPPNSKGYARDTVPSYDFSISPFRTRDLHVRLQDHATRILVLGDSQTFGLGLSDSEPYPAVWEKLSAGPVQVFNGGVPGYSPCNVRDKLIRLFPVIRPHIVVIAFFSENALVPDMGNDLYGAIHCVPEKQIKEKQINDSLMLKSRTLTELLRDSSHLYSLLSTVKNKVLKRPTMVDRVREYQANPENRVALSHAWESVRQTLTEIREVATKDNAKLFILSLPSHSSLALNDNSSTRKLADMGFDVVSPFEELKNVQDSIFFSDGHYNQKGHQIVANKLYQEIIIRFPSSP